MGVPNSRYIREHRDGLQIAVHNKPIVANHSRAPMLMPPEVLVLPGKLSAITAALISPGTYGSSTPQTCTQWRLVFGQS